MRDESNGNVSPLFMYSSRFALFVTDAERGEPSPTSLLVLEGRQRRVDPWQKRRPSSRPACVRLLKVPLDVCPSFPCVQVKQPPEAV